MDIQKQLRLSFWKNVKKNEKGGEREMEGEGEGDREIIKHLILNKYEWMVNSIQAFFFFLMVEGG